MKVREDRYFALQVKIKGLQRGCSELLPVQHRNPSSPAGPTLRVAA